MEGPVPRLLDHAFTAIMAAMSGSISPRLCDLLGLTLPASSTFAAAFAHAERRIGSPLCRSLRPTNRFCQL